MTGNNLTLYRVLVKLGVSDTDAESAATLDSSTLATKADLAELKAATKADLAELKAELFKHTTQTLMWMTGITAALLTTILALFRFLGGTP